MADQPVVEVLPAEMGVPCSSAHLEDAIIEGQERDIEGPTAEIEDEDILFACYLAIEPIGDRCGGGLVDDSSNCETRDDPSILGCLSLVVVEVRRNGDDRVRYLAAEMMLGGLLHLQEHHRRYFFGRELLGLPLVLHLDVGLVPLPAYYLERPVFHVRLNYGVAEVSADQSLCIEDRVRWIARHLIPRRVSDETFLIGECHI